MGTLTGGGLFFVLLMKLTQFMCYGGQHDGESQYSQYPFDIVAMVLHLKVSAHTTMEDIGEISVLYCVKIFFIEDKELNGISVQAL